jgi:PKD repeat protein
VEIVFGDGSGAVSLGNLTGTTSVTHVYLTAGTYTAVVTLVDASGERVSTSAVVRVVPAVPLNVNIAASPTTGTVDEVVSFTATVTGSAVPIESFEWIFGDGTSATTSGTTVNHVYTTAGTRTVTVTATTVEGVSGSSQLTLIVVPLVIEVTLNINPVTANSGQPVTFTATVSPGTVVITRYDWIFGDAGGSTASTTGRTTTFAYGVLDKGTTRTVTVTAVAFDGTTAQTQGLVNINP